MPKTDFPRTVYVAVETDDGVTRLVASDDPKYHADLEGVAVVGEYQFVRRVRVANKTTVEGESGVARPSPRRKRE